MRKIKNMEQLQAEKMRLTQEQKNLEEKMRTNLKEVKESLRPVNLVKDTIVNAISTKTSSNGSSSIRNGLIFYGISLLARKLGSKIVSQIFKK